MEKQWIENIRKRFADRRMPAPDGLWESIESAMNGLDGVGTAGADRRGRARSVAIWRRRAIAVAACFVGLCGIVSLLMLREAPTTEQNTLGVTNNAKRRPSTDGTHDDSATLVAKAVTGREPLLAQRLTYVTAAHAATPAEALPSADDSTADNAAVHVDEQRHDDNTSERKTAREYKPERQSGMGASSSFQHSGKGGHGAVSVSVYGSGLASLGNTSGNTGVMAVPASIEPGTLGSDVRLKATALWDRADDGTQDDVKVKHRHPVKFGASVRFALTDRLGLETGLMYSLHSSDIVSGDDYGGYMTEQTLHFIGVPLNVNYSIWRTKRLEVYASAGASAELCVSGKSHTDYLSGKDIVGSTDTDQRDARPQWAVNASAGVQYDFSKLVGVYLEPGVSYYFDNGSDVRTIYKDKPFNFNLNLGVRFTIR